MPASSDARRASRKPRTTNAKRTDITRTGATERTGAPTRAPARGRAPATSGAPAPTRTAAPARTSAPASTATLSSGSGRTFADLGVAADIVTRLIELDRARPFPVQEMTVADGLAGRDLLVRAPTGSGKTLAFSIPVVERAGRAEPGRPRALVLVPTRELASQVRDTIVPLAQVRRRRVATVYGGTNISRDQTTLRRGVDVLVATPGRLADLVARRDVDLGDVRLVVVDEADRMADMGFLPEVIRLLDTTRPDRQTLLFSATLDCDVDALTRRYQTDPIRHEVAEVAGETADVRHLFWPADRDQRRQLTGSIVRDVAPAIVFTRTKHGADRLVRQLRLDGIAAATIHGDRTQGQRERALAGFRAGEVTTLVATDVAARGIHVDDVAVVVHYDLAGSDKDYQHRSGRTGRAGSSGLVVTLVGADQHDDTATIQRSLDMPAGLHDIDMSQLTATEEPELAHAFAARASNGAGAGGRGRSNQGKGNGERTRARPQRTQARRGQGSSRSR